MGHTTETHPSADEFDSLFVEQGIDKEVNAFDDDPVSQDQCLTEVENAVATAKAMGPSFGAFSQHCEHVEIEPTQMKRYH